MSLSDLWKAQPNQLRNKQIGQLIAIAGEGTLRDGSTASGELREFLRSVPSKEYNIQHGS